MLGSYQLLDFLYSENGSSSIVIGETFTDLMGLSENQHLLFNWRERPTNDNIDMRNMTTNSSSWFQIAQMQASQSTNTILNNVARLRVGAFLSLAPGFRFSQFPQVTRQDSLVSFTSFVRLSNGLVQSVEQIPMSRFIVQMVDGITSDQIDHLKSDLQSITKDLAGVDVWDFRETSGPIEKASSILSYFFDFATGVAMLVCFFSLSSSMYTNIFEQTKEIGIVRAIGISKFSLYRIYVEEALCLILASSFAGIFIGSFVSYTMTLQRILFTQLPIPFVMPQEVLIVVGICSLFFSIAASWAPISFLLRQKIVTILR